MRKDWEIKTVVCPKMNSLLLKHNLIKSMAKLNSARNGRIGYVKYITVDIPFSKQSFRNIFDKFDHLMSRGKHDSSKLVVSIQDLTSIFGHHWNIVVHKNTTTRQRIIGDVTLHHRPKFICVYDNTSCSR